LIILLNTYLKLVLVAKLLFAKTINIYNNIYLHNILNNDAILKKSKYIIIYKFNRY